MEWYRDKIDVGEVIEVANGVAECEQSTREGERGLGKTNEEVFHPSFDLEI